MVGVRCLVGCVLVFFSLVARAGAASSYTASVVSAETPTIVNAGGVTSRMTFAVKAANDSWQGVLYRNKSVVTSAATMSRLVRWTLFGVAAGVAADALVDILTDQGYSIDEENQAVTVPGASGGSANQRWYCDVIPGGWTSSLGSCISAQLAELEQNWGASWESATMLGWSPDGRCLYQGLYSTVRKAFACSPACVNGSTVVWGFCKSGPLPNTPITSPDIPPEWLPFMSPDDRGAPQVIDDELWPSVAPSVSPDLARDLLVDSNDVPWWTPEVRDAADQAARDAATDAGQDPSVSVAPLPDASVDPATAPTSAPEPWQSVPPSSGSQIAEPKPTEWPVFCEWVGETICGWFEWTKSPMEPVMDDPAVPVEEVSEPPSWSSGLSGGSCPAPISVPVMGASVAISWQPLCDLASMLRPLLVGLAGLSAALILLGQRAGGSGS